MLQLPILHTVRGGTDHGLSHYGKWAGCARRATLDSLARDNGQRTSSDSDGTAIGYVFHAYLEEYFRGNLSQETPLAKVAPGAEPSFALEFSDDAGWSPEDAIRLEAERLFDAYRKRFTREECGEVLGLEIELTPPETRDAYETAVRAALGVWPVTCRLDKAVRASVATTQGWQTTRGIEVEPGIWGWDYKTSLSPGKDEQLSWELNYQMQLGIMLWNIVNPATPMQGILVDAIYKHSRLETVKKSPPSFKTYVVRADEAKQRALRSYLNGLITIKEHPVLGNWPNGSLCFWPKTCPYLTNNKCDRT